MECVYCAVRAQSLDKTVWTSSLISKFVLCVLSRVLWAQNTLRADRQGAQWVAFRICTWEDPASIWTRTQALLIRHFSCLGSVPLPERRDQPCHRSSIILSDNPHRSLLRPFLPTAGNTPPAAVAVCLRKWFVGKDNSVVIATRYRLNGPEIKSRWGRDFRRPYRPAMGPTQPPIQCVLGLSREVKQPGSGADPGAN